MKKFIKVSLIVMLVITLLAVSGGGIAYASITKNAEIDNNLLPKDTVKAVFVSENGNRIQGIADDFTAFEEIPDNLKNAVVALEDKRFYQHKGVDYVRLAGAAVNNVKSRSFSEGGSTITQQLIKNTHLTQEKTVNRKLKEIKLAKQLEKKYSKDEILTMYLNVVYFGNGMYGVKSAAKGFFNKNVNDLSLSECATLAAVLKNPSKYSPIADAENSKIRRNLVLNLMCEQKYISDTESTNAQSESVSVDRSATFSNTQSYMLSAAYEAASILKISVQTLLSGDYVVNTYMNDGVQKSVTDITSNPSYYLLNGNGVRAEGISIVIDNKTLGVQAYFSTKKHNIYDFSRPFGSAIKPILVYAPALHNNAITAATPVLDELTDFSGYSPENYGSKYLGWITVRDAVKTSSNVAAVKTYNALGFDKVRAFADSVNIKLGDNDNATLALGNLAENNTFMDILGAYGALANNGTYAKPSFVKSITDSNGKVLYSHENSAVTVLSPENAYILTDILVDTAKNGTARGLNGLDFEVAAKTGTVGNTFGNTDAYNIGYTTENTYLVWHGNSTGNSENDLDIKETGGSYVTRAAKDILKSINTENPAGFTPPDGVSMLNIDLYALKNNQTVQLATENTPAEYIYPELFSYNNRPTEYSNVFDNFGVDNATAEIDNGIIKISFDTADYLYYDIEREVKGKRQLLKTINPSSSGTATYYDVSAPVKKNVKYYIKPYFYNQNGEKIVGNEYVTDTFHLKYKDYWDNLDY